MANVIKTTANSVKFTKPSYIVATVFQDGDTDTPSGDVYILEDIKRDTTSITQDENSETKIERETSDTPIYSVVTLGNYQFSAECADTQADLLKGLCGFKVVDGKAYAPSTYVDLYAKIDVVKETAGGSLIAYVLPKVQLNSRVVIESLNSDLGKINLAGTGQNIHVADGDGNEFQSPFYTDDAYVLPTTGE